MTVGFCHPIAVNCDQLPQCLATNTYHMTKERQREPGDPFPTSRHLVLDQNRQPAVPLGWVLVTLQHKEE